MAALLFHGADVNCKAPFASASALDENVMLSPLEIATKHNHPEIVRILLAYGASQD